MDKGASGKFVLRLPPTVHAALRREASSRNVSLNTVCQQVLEEHVMGASRASIREGNQELVARIRNLLGESLRAVVLFGSVARGDSREGSDIDLLIVVSADQEVTRKLYSAWDEQFGVDAHSPHFVKLPARAADARSLWLEASVDGVMYYDRDGATSRLLGDVRRLIATGMFARRSAYGLPYWVRSDADAADCLQRAGHRLKALEVLMQEESWADVVREAQELVEITLKALLRGCGVEVPRIHDVSPVLEQNRERLSPGIRSQVDELIRISRSLRRDRELAFYGSEDLTPSDFYTREDASAALADARFVHAEVAKAHLLEDRGDR